MARRQGADGVLIHLQLDATMVALLLYGLPAVNHPRACSTALGENCKDCVDAQSLFHSGGHKACSRCAGTQRRLQPLLDHHAACLTSAAWWIIHGPGDANWTWIAINSNCPARTLSALRKKKGAGFSSRRESGQGPAWCKAKPSRLRRSLQRPVHALAHLTRRAVVMLGA